MTTANLLPREEPPIIVAPNNTGGLTAAQVSTLVVQPALATAIVAAGGGGAGSQKQVEFDFSPANVAFMALVNGGVNYIVFLPAVALKQFLVNSFALEVMVTGAGYNASGANWLITWDMPAILPAQLVAATPGANSLNTVSSKLLAATPNGQFSPVAFLGPSGGVNSTVGKGLALGLSQVVTGAGAASLRLTVNYTEIAPLTP